MLYSSCLRICLSTCLPIHASPSAFLLLPGTLTPVSSLYTWVLFLPFYNFLEKGQEPNCLCVLAWNLSTIYLR